MGMYDTVLIKCPECKDVFPVQSKSGPCNLKTYRATSAPISVLVSLVGIDFICGKCGSTIVIKVEYKATVEFGIQDKEDESD